MAKKELNPFSVSFLDLLSGALAAVIILFIIVPKLNNQQQEILQTVDSLNVTSEQLQELIERARNSISRDLYEQMQQQLNQLNQQIEQLQQQAANLTQQLSQCQQENEQLRRQLQEQKRRTEAVASGGPGAKMFGVNAKFAVVCMWNKDLDVDLYLKDINTNKWIYYGKPQQRFGKYLTDIRHVEPGEDIFEMIYQPDTIVPGTYEVWYHLYTGTEDTVTVRGYVVLFPFSPNEQKVKFNDKVIHHNQSPIDGGGVKVAIIHLTQNSMNVQLY